MSELRQNTTGAALLYSDSLATQADIARLEAKIDRLLALLDPPKLSTVVEFKVDGNAIARAFLPYDPGAAGKTAK